MRTNTLLFSQIITSALPMKLHSSDQKNIRAVSRKINSASVTTIPPFCLLKDLFLEHKMLIMRLGSNQEHPHTHTLLRWLCGYSPGCVIQMLPPPLPRKANNVSSHLQPHTQTGSEKYIESQLAAGITRKIILWPHQLCSH